MYRSGVIDVYEYYKELIGVRLPFTHGAMAEFLMGADKNTDPFENNLTYHNENVYLYLPKFDHVGDHNLNDKLRKEELGEMFLPGNIMRLCGNDDARIGFIKQLVYFRFDEKGAEVKAVTYGIAIPEVMAQPQYRTIRFNKPFHYRIVKNGIPLVQGYFEG